MEQATTSCRPVVNEVGAPRPNPNSLPVARVDDGARSLSTAVVGTFPPTQCGIATYSANISAALRSIGIKTGVVRVATEFRDDDWPSDIVVWNWTGGSDHEVRAAANAASTYDTVLVQHEFGIYPGEDGASIVGFVEACTRPVIVVMHTVLTHPSDHQRAIVDDLLVGTSLAIVHTEVARERLLDVHHVEASRVAILPHGARPNLDGPQLLNTAEPIVITWGLLGPGKGIEAGIEAIARMRSAGVSARYIVAGETHPNVRAREGEQYRNHLIRLASSLGVSDQVDFVNCYADWDTLHALVRSATVVLLPYDSRDQVTSGVLVEALAAAKPVVATAFPHAVELSRSGAVEVIPHGSPAACAAALTAIITSDERRVTMTRAALSQAVRHDWTNVAIHLSALMAAELSVPAR